ncbi:putative hydrolase [Trueperella bonasi]|uniref:Hydrolase n=1 Tax=Trueperella bonasi TaxID=312286 RepID=A0ABT9NIZ7_9ACTO|nr:zinc-dependent metalloprotease [Trueperella bonasi]MDP9806793.1 putative hydrolase [Trueperella bonasi]
MSTSDHNGRGEPDHNWEEMLRAVFGEDGAEQIIEQLKSEGQDPAMAQLFNPANITMVTQQIQSMLGSSGEGPVNWQLAERVARETVTRAHADKLTAEKAEETRSAMRTASLWLDAACEFNPAKGPNMALNRLDWIAHSLGTFRKLIDPIGANVSRAFTDAFSEQTQQMPPQMAQMFGDPSGFISKMIASVLGVQYGGALAELAVKSFGSTDTGVPLLEGSSAILVPSNVSEFAAGLDVPKEEILLYIAVQEAAAVRLYTAVPWLRPRVLDTIAQIASGIEINMDSIEEQVQGMAIDPMNPGAMPEIDMSNIFILELSQEQEDSVERLQHLLSLIEGWVAEVSARAVLAHLPNAVPMRELFTRRYATDNPAKAVWEAQLGVELAAQRQREAAAFWQRAEAEKGIAGRDALWAHPDLLPSSKALDDPESFFAAEQEDIEAELDTFLEELFSDDNQPKGPHEAAFGDDTPTEDEAKD